MLEDLGFPATLDTVVLSEEEGVEKPAQEIFLRTIGIVNEKVLYGQRPLDPAECLHIGDELIW